MDAATTVAAAVAPAAAASLWRAVEEAVLLAVVATVQLSLSTTVFAAGVAFSAAEDVPVRANEKKLRRVLEWNPNFCVDLDVAEKGAVEVAREDVVGVSARNRRRSRTCREEAARMMKNCLCF